MNMTQAIEAQHYNNKIVGIKVAHSKVFPEIINQIKLLLTGS